MRPYLVRTAVFAGPSLAVSDRPQISGLTFLPPASRYDVINAAREYDAVLLIDGVFHHDLAPSPKECYEALSHARMFGASSMGALRAAECAPYGFTPLGAIARWYVSEKIDGDDEVAVLTHPETHAALSVPLVNVRYLAWRAVRRGVLSREQGANLVARSRSVFYMERTWDDVLDVAPEEHRAALRALIDDQGDLKALDARFGLRSMLRTLRRAVAA